MSATLSLKIENDPAELERLSAAVEEIGRREGWPSDLVSRVNLVLEELALNIITHGYDDGRHEIELSLTSEPDAVTIRIEDAGQPFDPLSDAPEPDVDAPIEDRAVGGLGIHLVRAMMDEIRYERDRGKNRLTLVSRRAE